MTFQLDINFAMNSKKFMNNMKSDLKNTTRKVYNCIFHETLVYMQLFY